MNQIQIQSEREKRMLEKADILVKNKRVSRSIIQESRNIWMVASYSTPKKWYIAKWNEELDAFMYACKTFEYSVVSSCIHIFAADVYIFAGEKV